MSEFTATVLVACRDALSKFPDGVTMAVIAEAARVGPGDVRRLRRTLDRLKAYRVLAKGGRGVFKAGDRIGCDDVLGVSARVKAALATAFADYAGIMTPGEIQEALGMADEAGVRAVQRVIAASTEYLQGPIPIDGMAWAIRLHETERLKLPVPGFRLWDDLVLELDATGLPCVGDMLSEVCERRCAIGRAVRQAREAAGLEIADVGAEGLGEVFRACMEHGRNVHLGLEAEETTATWWGRLVADHGASDAFVVAWENLEAGAPVGGPCVVEAITAEFWRKLGAWFSVDPAAVSRGRVA